MATSPKTANADLVSQAQLTTVTIIRGTYVLSDEESVRPGGTVDVDAAELARLKRIGMVKDESVPEPEEVQDGTLKVTSESGPSVTSAS